MTRAVPDIQQDPLDHGFQERAFVLVVSAEDFDSWQETIYLLRSPVDARRLMEAVARDKSGEAVVVKTMEELEALAGE